MAEKKKKILESLNPFARCKKYNLPLWQCPQFLFVLMGALIIAAIFITYFIAIFRIGDPGIVSLVVLVVGGSLIIIDYIITNSFERIAQASKMKSEFINVVSHQLRSPLTNLKYSIELLAKKSERLEKNDRDEYFEILKENTKRMGVLINNLLTVSRMESGKLPLKEKNASLVEVTEKLISDLKPSASASGVEISLEAGENIPQLWVDPFWLGQAVENLLDNAIRYIKGGGKVEIKINRRGKKVFFEVRDNGVGIPKDEQKFIFQRFFRSKNVLKQQTEGTGLGLHITKRVLELMGGKIWFHSKEEEGTTFYFFLPIKKRKTKVKSVSTNY